MAYVREQDTDPGRDVGAGGDGATDRDVHIDTDTDADTAKARCVIQQVHLQNGDLSNGPGLSAQPHSDPE